MWFDDLANAVRKKYATEKSVPQDTPTPTIDDFGIALMGNTKWAEPVRDEVMGRMDALLEAYIDSRRAVLSTPLPPHFSVLRPAQVGRDLYNVLYHHSALQRSTSEATVREVLWAINAMDEVTNGTCLHPLAPLIEQWFTRPLPVARNKHSGPGIMAAPWQIDESAPRSGRLLRYFPQPTHLDTAKSGQILLPGFGDGRTEGMPSEFWELVGGSNSEVPSIAQRLAIFAPMQLNLADRKPGRAMSVTVPMSKFRDWAFPDTGAKRGRIRPRELLRGLEAASKQLDNYIINCLVDHGDGHIEYVRNLHPLRLGTLTEKWSRNGRNLQYEDSDLELIQTFSPGRVDTGPAVPTSLTYWGARNIRAWRLSLNLAYYNYDPGVTGARINKGQWIDFRDPDAYPVVDDRKLLELVDPRNADAPARAHLQRARRTLALQEGRGDVKVIYGADGERRIIQTTPRDRRENGEET